MSSNESKLKHLEFIQNTINRMAGNSFLLKGWAVTLVSALLAFSFKELNWLYVTVSVSVLVFFWLLDSYYLHQERAYIKLYEHAIKQEGETDMAMDAKSYRAETTRVSCVFSPTMRLFYGGLFFVHVLVLLIILKPNLWPERYFSASIMNAMHGAQAKSATATSSILKTSTASSIR